MLDQTYAELSNDNSPVLENTEGRELKNPLYLNPTEIKNETQLDDSLYVSVVHICVIDCICAIYCEWVTL